MDYKIYNADAMDFLRSLDDESVDAILTDPPYSSGGAFRGDRVASTGTKYINTGTKLRRADFQGDNRDQRAYLYWCALWLGECLRVSRIGAPICLFTDWRQIAVTIDALQIGGFIWRGIVPWNKTEAARPVYGRYRAQCEYVIWGSNGPMPLNNGRPPLPGFYQYVVRQADKHHIAGKPTRLMADLLEITNPGEIVLDPFMGSGTTGVACVQTGRRFIGCERAGEYYRVAERRLAEASEAVALGRAHAA